MPYTRYAKNPQTGEYVGWDGVEWKSVHPREVPGTAAYDAVQRQPAMREAEARAHKAVDLPSFEGQVALSAAFPDPSIDIAAGLVTGDWRTAKAKLGGIWNAVKSVTGLIPSSETAPRTKQIYDTFLPEPVADYLTSMPWDPLSTTERTVGMATGLWDAGKRAVTPSLAYFGENRPPTEAENLDALTAATELESQAALPYVAGPAADATGKAVRGARTKLGVKKPASMMNTMLAEGAPREIAESLDRSMDRKTYTPQDPRVPGQSDVGLRVLDEVGVVGNANKGAAATRVRLNEIHDGVQQQLQRFSDVQIPSQDLLAAIRDPIAKRLRDATDRVSTANPQVLDEMLKAHVKKFTRETGGRTDPATINQYKASLYELLNSADFKKSVGADPSLHGIMREQANGLMQLVNRYTVDPKTGISPVAELNRAYSDLRPGLDAYEGLMLRDQMRKSSSSVIAPSGISPEAIATAETRKGIFSGLGRTWNSPARVTLNARLLRTLAPPVASVRRPSALPPEALPTLPEQPPTLPPDLDTTVFSQSAPEPIQIGATAPAPAPRPVGNLAAEHARLIAERDAIINQEAQTGVEGQNHNLRLKEIAATRKLPTLPSEPTPLGEIPVQPRASQSTAADASTQAAARARLPVLDIDPATQLGDRPIQNSRSNVKPIRPMDPDALGPRVEGGRYYNGYWDQTYTVESINPNGSITVKWEDGTRTTHRTAWDPKSDRVLSLGESKPQKASPPLGDFLQDLLVKAREKLASDPDVAPLVPKTTTGKPNINNLRAVSGPKLPELDPSVQLGDRPKAAIAAKPASSTQPTKPVEPVESLDYSKMSETDLRAQLRKAEQHRDTVGKVSPGSRVFQGAQKRVQDIQSALESKSSTSNGPKRVSALRRGQKIEGLEVRSFATRSNGKAMVLRADDGSERLVFESEVT